MCAADMAENDMVSGPREGRAQRKGLHRFAVLRASRLPETRREI